MFSGVKCSEVCTTFLCAGSSPGYARYPSSGGRLSNIHRLVDTLGIAYIWITNAWRTSLLYLVAVDMVSFHCPYRMVSCRDNWSNHSRGAPLISYSRIIPNKSFSNCLICTLSSKNSVPSLYCFDGAKSSFGADKCTWGKTFMAAGLAVVVDVVVTARTPLGPGIGGGVAQGQDDGGLPDRLQGVPDVPAYLNGRPVFREFDRHIRSSMTSPRPEQRARRTQGSPGRPRGPLTTKWCSPNRYLPTVA